MSLALSHFAAVLYARPLGAALLAALIGLMAFQIPAAPRLGAAESEEAYEEFEEETTDPTEADGEQGLDEFVGPISGRLRRDAEMVQPLVGQAAQRGPVRIARQTIAAELAHRNGFGAPLRC